MKTLNPVGWGYVEDALSEAERTRVVSMAGHWFPKGLGAHRPPPAPEAVTLPPSRVKVPEALAAFVDASHAARLLHACGRSFRDLAALRAGSLDAAPDAVATPRDAAELARVLEWADAANLALIPYGGGSSVVGGVNPEGIDGFGGVVTLSLRGMAHVLEVDERSASVHAEAGILGPDLEDALKPHGLAVRHFPQSYFHSTLGGWAATRGAGHYSTGLAKIEDRVQALGVTLADGRRVETRRLPASSIGPDPNRLWLGSEGCLGVITDVHLRCVRLPVHKRGAGVRFKTFEQALEASRAMLQADLRPTQLRVLDPVEHLLSRALGGRAASGALTVLSFESAGAPVDAPFEAALELCRQHGGTPQDPESKDDGVGDWRNTFFRQPYLRDGLLDHAIISDTFETAVPWSAVPGFYHAVRDAVMAALTKVCGGGMVTCRSTHAYMDGCSLYFAFLGPGRHGDCVSQWWELKSAAAQAVRDHGGTQSHHHAMGRDHRRWADLEVPQPFRAAVRAARGALDPAGRLNPGLWFDD